MIDCGTVLANRESLYGVRMIDDGTWWDRCVQSRSACAIDRVVCCREWPSCFACTIDRVFFATDGRAALLCAIDLIRGFVATGGRGALFARSIVASLPRMAVVSLRYIQDPCIDVALAGAAPCPDVLCARHHL